MKKKIKKYRKSWEREFYCASNSFFLLNFTLEHLQLPYIVFYEDDLIPSTDLYEFLIYSYHQFFANPRFFGNIAVMRLASSKYVAKNKNLEEDLVTFSPYWKARGI